jgi:hypothetical protein
MEPKTVGSYQLAPVSFGSPCSYELCGDHIVSRLFGIIRLRSIHLGAVHYLRLATRSEVPPAYLVFNWPQFLLSSRRSVCPVYILQTRSGHRFCLKLQGGAHFKLRQAIARHSDRRQHKQAA